MLLTGIFPFDGNTSEEIYQKVSKANVSFSKKQFLIVSDEAKDLLAKLLFRRPDSRIKADQALQHPWIRREVEKEAEKVKLDGQVVSLLKRYSASNK